jgi:hypothetical protein
VIAGLLHFPSHVSLESALWHHGLIPEAVREVTCVTSLRSRRFSNSLGDFSYTRVPTDSPRAGVRRITLPDRLSAYVAGPVRAIADLVYARKGVSWSAHGTGFLTDSMRMDLEDLGALVATDFDEVLGSSRDRRTRRFLAGLRKELLQ